jgi:spore germination cell wall hydrolase CwlJ-like protein
MKKFNHLKTLILAGILTTGTLLLPMTEAFAATYTVQSGDSLYKISKLFDTSTTNLLNDNNLNNNTIYSGQTLYVSSKTHTVENGESLYLISKKYGITIDNLRKANNLWTDNIYPGQVLNIPGATSTTSSSNTTTSSNSISYTESDVDLLARLITAEAEGEPYNGKLAVGAVVLNRVESDLFPNSISSVIYQTVDGYYQFTPVLNGYINKTATADSVKAAYEVLNGTDPTNGALFFYDYTVTNQWLLSKQVATTIANLTFAY